MRAMLAGDAARKQKSTTSWLGSARCEMLETVQIFCKLFHAALLLAADLESQVVHSQASVNSWMHHFCGSTIAPLA
jgi:hypothetical protein